MVTTPDSRILILSLRNVRRNLARAALYEFEDAVRDFDRADLLAPRLTPEWGSRARVWASRLAQVSGVQLAAARRLEAVEIPRRRYQLLFFTCETRRDLRLVGPLLPRLRERCDAAICWIGEIWAEHVRGDRKLFEALRAFDHIYSSSGATVPVLGEGTGRDCQYDPLGVDALRFCPWTENPPRWIDLYSLGRRAPETHRALLQMADRGELFYVYDTTAPDFRDHTEHRKLLARMLQRSRYFIANKAKNDLPDQTQGQEEFGMRFFEGAASGTVMIGDPPRTEAFRRCFDWPDALIEFPFGGEQIGALLRELDAQPERLARIREANVVQSLRRYDWVHIWARYLDRAGVAHTPEMEARRACLEQLAAHGSQRVAA
jgi:hypothetical protein